jgi:hypothetical protein
LPLKEAGADGRARNALVQTCKRDAGCGFWFNFSIRKLSYGR